MFITDRGECKREGHEVNHILSSDQYNDDYPGLLRNFVNDYYFDDIVNWTLNGQKTYDELCQLITSFELVEQLGPNTYRYATTDVDFIWITDDNMITIIVEIGKRNVCYLKNIVKLDNDKYFTELFILLTTTYSKLLLPFNICEQEILNHEIDNSDFCGMSYYSNNLQYNSDYRIDFTNQQYKKFLKTENKKLIVMLCKNKHEWRITLSKCMIISNLLSYTKIRKEMI